MHCLPHLRFLELVFSPYIPQGWPQRGHHAVLDWDATVEWIRGKVDAPALTIRVIMADFGDDSCVGRQVLTERQGRIILDAYGLIMHPLKPLAAVDGLAGFYAHAAFPWRWTRKTFLPMLGEAPGEYWRWLAEKGQELKEGFEKDVRGGKVHSRTEPSESLWRRWSDI